MRPLRMKGPELNEPKPPQISAESYCVFDCNNQKFILSELMYLRREIASMTKMMTLLTCLRLMKKYGIENPNREEIIITRNAAKVKGTTANL